MIRQAKAALMGAVAELRSRGWDSRGVGTRLADAATIAYLLGYERIAHIRAGDSAAAWKREGAKPGR